MSEFGYLAVPPQSLDNERSVLGCLLLHNQSFDEIGDELREEHFYNDTHGLIYSTIRRLRAAENRLTRLHLQMS